MKRTVRLLRLAMEGRDAIYESITWCLISRISKERIMLKPEYGKCYEVTLSDGKINIYRFDGFGEHMKYVWIDIETDEMVIGFVYTDIREVQYT